MALRDDFREAMATGNPSEALLLAMSKAIELQITTWVAPESSLKDSRALGSALPGERLRAKINLIDGKIEHEVGERFIGYGPYRELRDYHQAQVARSPELIRHNLQTLQKLFEVLSVLRQQNPSSSNRDAQQPPLELSPLPPLISVPPLTQPDLPLASTSVIPSLRETSAPLTPLPDLEPPAPPAAPTPEAPLQPPAPETPVSNLEIEDWEEAVGLQIAPPFPPTPPSAEGEPLASRQVLPEPPLEPLDVEDLSAPPVAPVRVHEEEVRPSPAPPSLSQNSEVFSEADWAEARQELSQLEPIAPPVASPEVRQDAIAPPVSPPPNSVPAPHPPASAEFSSADWGAAIGTTAANLTPEQSSVREQRFEFPEVNESEPKREETIAPPPTLSLEKEPLVGFIDDDWGDLNREEAIAPPPTLSLEKEPLVGFIDDDWGDLKSEAAFIPPPVQPLERVETFAAEEDWGDAISDEAVVIEPPVQPLERVEVLERKDEEDWGDVGFEETPAQSLENEQVLDLEDEEDWGDVVVEETPIQSLENEQVLDLEDEEDWGDVVVEETPIQSLENERVLDLEDEEDWGDVVVEETPIQSLENERVFDLEDEEDWGDVVVEETPIQSLENERVFDLEDEEDWGDVGLEAPPLRSLEEDEEDWGDVVVEETPAPSLEKERVFDLEDEEDWDDLTSSSRPTERLAIADELLDESWLDDLSGEEETERNARISFPADDELLEEDWEEDEDEKVWTSETSMLADVVPDLHFDDEEWGEYTDDDLDTEPSVPDLRSVSLPNRREWDAVNTPAEPLESRTENLTFDSEFEDENDDWIGLTEETLTRKPDAGDRASVNLEREEWADNWFEEEPSVRREGDEIANVSHSSEDEWEDFESLDPFANPIDPESLLSDVELEEDWDDFAAEELEPYPNTSLLNVDESVLEAFELNADEREANGKTPPANPSAENGKSHP